MSAISRQRRAALSRKQEAFVREYDRTNGNGTQAARNAGYSASSDAVLAQQAYENLRKPEIKRRLAQLDAEIAATLTPNRVKVRLHEISHEAQANGQYGPAVRAEELIGKSLGMWVEQTLNVNVEMRSEHVQALLEVAKKRAAQPIDLEDDEVTRKRARLFED